MPIALACFPRCFALNGYPEQFRQAEKSVDRRRPRQRCDCKLTRKHDNAAAWRRGRGGVWVIGTEGKDRIKDRNRWDDGNILKTEKKGARGFGEVKI